MGFGAGVREVLKWKEMQGRFDTVRSKIRHTILGVVCMINRE